MPPRTIRYEHPPPWISGDDEINIADLLRKLGRRWYWIVGCTTLALLLGFAYAATRVPVYEYTAAIAIGSTPGSSGSSLLESTTNTIARLNNALIPQAVREAIASPPSAERPASPAIQVDSPPNSSIIRLRAEGSQEHEPLITAALSGVLTRLSAEHDTLHRNAIGQHEIALEKANIRLAELEDDRLFERGLDEARAGIDQAERLLAHLESRHEELTAQLQHLDERAELLSRRRMRLENHLETTTLGQQTAIAGTEEPIKAMSMLLIGQQIQEARNRLDEVEETLVVGIPDQRVRLRSELSRNRNDREMLERSLDRLRQEPQVLEIQRQQAIRVAQAEASQARNQMASIVPTRIISEPVQSLSPVGASDTRLVTLATLLGLMVGVFLALLAGAFDPPVRDRRTDTASGPEE